MVNGMATKKVTITMPEGQLERVQKLVAQGVIKSVSGFVTHAVSMSLDDVEGYGAMLREGLDRTGGPMTRKERAWADRILGMKKRRRKRAV
jgi:Arc/MetJ-type ribon-helix-helix transcriptional regulator